MELENLIDEVEIYLLNEGIDSDNVGEIYKLGLIKLITENFYNAKQETKKEQGK